MEIRLVAGARGENAIALRRRCDTADRIPTTHLGEVVARLYPFAMTSRISRAHVELAHRLF
jgi:hypothetical protein